MPFCPSHRREMRCASMRAQQTGYATRGMPANARRSCVRPWQLLRLTLGPSSRLAGTASGIQRAWGAPSETSILYPASTPPRSGRRASPRSASRWRDRAPCRPWPWSSSCRPDGTARRYDLVVQAVCRGPCLSPRRRNGHSAHSDADFAGVREFDGVTNEIEQHLREALFVPEANRERLVHGRREGELLVLGERLGGRAHRLDHALYRVF